MYHNNTTRMPMQYTWAEKFLYETIGRTCLASHGYLWFLGGRLLFKLYIVTGFTTPLLCYEVPKLARTSTSIGVQTLIFNDTVVHDKLHLH